MPAFSKTAENVVCARCDSNEGEGGKFMEFCKTLNYITSTQLVFHFQSEAVTIFD